VVECDLAKVEVAGSNPVSRSTPRAYSGISIAALRHGGNSHARDSPAGASRMVFSASFPVGLFSFETLT
jgi:hypothetical protein